MVLYSLEAVNALLRPIQKNSRLPHFQQPLASRLSVLRRPTEIISCRPPHIWLGRLTHDQRKSFPPQNHIMDRDRHSWEILRNAHESDHIRLPRAGKRGVKIKKEISDSYDVILMALKATFKRVIDKAYHTTGNTGIMGDGFGQLTPFEILQRLRKKYGRANIQEIEAKLLHLNNPMDRNLSVEVMIRDIEDVQHFILANPANNMELTDVQLCTNGLIKLSKTSGLYANTTERWNLKDRAICQKWMEFKTHFIAEYKNILTANGGTTMGQEGYETGGAYSAIDDDGSSLAESIVKYAESATQAKGEVNESERRLAALEMGPPPQHNHKMDTTPHK